LNVFLAVLIRQLAILVKGPY